MQKHFAVVTGIGMLAVAGIVVSQQAGFFQDSLKGSLPDGGGSPYMSTGYTPAYSASSVMSSVATSACANPRNCTTGPINGTCDANTCRQEFNTGMCKPGTSACATYWSTCSDTSQCTPMSSSSSVDSCGGSCEQYGLCCNGAGECGDCFSSSSVPFSPSSSATVCTGAGEIDCGYGVCCSTNDGYCDAGACIPYMMSSSSSENPESCSGPDYNPPSCGNENNPPPFSSCAPGFHIVDQGCQEGTCGCSESTTGPKIRCQHTFVCERI